MKQYECRIDIVGEHTFLECRVLDSKFEKRQIIVTEDLETACVLFLRLVKEQFGLLFSKVVGIKVYEVPQETQQPE